MKKLFLSLMLVFSCLLVFNSCNKSEKIVSPVKQVTSQTSANKNIIGGGSSQGGDDGCFTSADRDCIDCTFPNCTAAEYPGIPGCAKYIAYGDFQIAVGEGPSAIAAYFTSGSWDVLFPNLDGDRLTNLQSGDYDFNVVVNNGKTFYISHKVGYSDIDVVLPVVEE